MRKIDAKYGVVRTADGLRHVRMSVSVRDYRLLKAVARHASAFATGELSLRNDPPVTYAAKLKAAVAALNRRAVTKGGEP